MHRIIVLSGNYLTYQVKSDQSGGSPHCRICKSDSETSSHVIGVCEGMAEERERMFEELKQLCKMTKNNIDYNKIISDEKVLCQFILDPASLNLTNRVSLSDPIISQFYKFAREFYYLIDKTRIRLLNNLKIEQMWKHKLDQKWCISNPLSLYLDECDNILD